MKTSFITPNQKDTLFDHVIIFKLSSCLIDNGNYFFAEKIIYKFLKEININKFKYNIYFFKVLKKKKLSDFYFISSF
jgi:hypothetical protein